LPHFPPVATVVPVLRPVLTLRNCLTAGQREPQASWVSGSEAEWRFVDHTTMTLGNPGQETELRASPRSRRSTSRAFRRSLTAHRNGQQDEYEAQLTNTFGLLREGWERAVEELLLNQTVMRFDHRVQTQRIKNLHDIRQGDIDEIDAGMSVCSKWLPGHAQAPAINEPLPEPAALLAEIERLERFAQEMRKRGRS
jgi:hypothetical protein